MTEAMNGFNVPDGIVVHNYVIKREGIKKKIIYHFSDVHLTECDSLSDEQETERSKKATEEWKNIRNYFATTYNDAYTESQTVSAKEHFANLLKVSESGDAFVMAGDICDYMCGANLRLIEKSLKEMKTPCMAVAGNHEKTNLVNDGEIFSSIANPVQTLDLGDLLIVGIDNSTNKITKEQNEQLKAILSGDKPVIISMHLPMMTEENEPRLKPIPKYFYINHNEAPAENFEFIEIIKEYKEKIVAVLAGHLHFFDNSKIVEGVTQYVSSQGILGHINRYEIGE